MFKFKIKIIIFIVLTAIQVKASEYYEHYSDAFASKMYLINYDKFIIIQDKNKTGLEIEYSPKNDFYINQLGYEYCINNLSLFFSTSIYNVGVFSFFNTRMFSLYYYIYKFAFDIYYSKYDLYTLYEIGDDNDEERFDSYPEPELLSTNYGLNVYWVLSDNFSYNAVFKQTERQSKSAGSFILYLSPYLSKYKATQILIPENQRIYYEDESELKAFSIKSLLASVGYCYNLTYSGFYIAPFGYVGKEYKIVTYNIMSGNEKKKGWENYYKWGFMLGYNESDSILVLEYFNEYRFVNINHSNIALLDQAINLIIGYRM